MQLLIHLRYLCALPLPAPHSGFEKVHVLAKKVLEQKHLPSIPIGTFIIAQSPDLLKKSLHLGMISDAEYRGVEHIGSYAEM